jgi:hypothetical protein
MTEPSAAPDSAAPAANRDMASMTKDELRVLARTLWESVPAASVKTVAQEVGVADDQVAFWKRSEGWVKAHRREGRQKQLATLAQEVANRMPPVREAGTPAEAKAAVQEFVQEFAIDVRAEVLQRHRREWAAARAVIYQTIEQAKRGDVAGAYERGKLAKITAEALQILQNGERAAYGIARDHGTDDRTIVVVDRGGSPGADEPGAIPGGEGADAAEGKEF